MPGKVSTIAVLGVVALVVVGGVMVGGIGNGPESDAETNQPGPASEGAASIEVQDAGSSAWIDESESLEPRITLSNEGERDGEQTIQIQMDRDGDGELDAFVGERTVTVPAGETNQVTFTLDAPGPGEHRYGVVVDGDVKADWSVEVLQSPAFAVEGTSVDVTPVQGEEATATVRLANDGDYSGDGTVALQFAGETVTERTVSIGADSEKTITMAVPTASVDPGAHEYTVSMEDSTATGDLQVLRPATVTVDDLGGELNVSRGSNATVEATVTNDGDVAGNDTVRLRGLGDEPYSRTVSLDAGESTVVEFVVATGDMSAGTYSYSVVTDAEAITASAGEGNETSTALEVRDGFFKLSDISGDDIMLIGERMTFAANVTNIGDASETQAVELGVDLVGDSTPEMLGVTRTVTLDPGEEKRVRFQINHYNTSGMAKRLEDLTIGSYIYGIYSDDTNETSVFDARPKVDLSKTVSDDESSDSREGTESLSATRDEISQAKYGIYYERLSGETKAQIDEVYERQSFAQGLGITDVLTREEIARQNYGLDVKVGDNFEFSEIDVELQQQIEADFDAQFTSQDGDRIESLDELAQREYGTDYEQLTESQRERIMRLYGQQFD
jgi:hypothetical protein